MHALPTVRVVNPAAPDGFVIINETDLRDDHELWREPEPAEAMPMALDVPLTVGKGPRGAFYVKRGRETVAGPFDSEEAALDAATKGDTP